MSRMAKLPVDCWQGGGTGGPQARAGGKYRKKREGEPGGGNKHKGARQ